MSAPFATHVDIQCVYPISGNYGIAPRFLYYCSVFFVALFQRYPKLTAGAAAYCISYAGATAVHAIILAVISGSSTPFLPDGYVSENATSSVWVASRVLDQDVDATFAVVGVGCLSSLILAVSTASFGKMAPTRSIIVLWGLLMFVGIVACMVNFYGVNESEFGPFLQSRFCPPGTDDALPLSGMSPPILGLDWNETVWSFFRNPRDTINNNDTLNAKCLYPCLASSQILRDQPDIQIINFSSLQIAGPGQVLYTMMAVITWGGLAPDCSGGICLSLSDVKRMAFKSVTVTVLQVYALIITPILMVVLIVFMEWSLSAYPRSETVWHVGQWSPLVGVGFVFIAILVSGRWAPSKRIPLPRVGMAQITEEIMSLPGDVEEK
ncbi:hypothetical protein PG989_001630 [Apiospora arundinis]